MPVDNLKGLAEADREEFLARLRTYGLDETSLLSHTLTTVPSSETSLRSDPAVSLHRPIILKTNDFDDVNRWIGVPDSVFDEIEGFSEAPKKARLKTAGVVFESHKLAAQPQLPDVNLRASSPTVARDLARAYLYGDSRKLAAYKPILAEAFPVIEIAIWPFLDVVVKSGSVLQFGPGPHVLVARTLTIEEGGKIRSYGNLKIDVTTAKKSKPAAVFRPNSALERLDIRFGSILREVRKNG